MIFYFFGNFSSPRKADRIGDLDFGFGFTNLPNLQAAIAPRSDQAADI
jgi:hypothetical protein